ncbi:MAG: type II toxin-antitoxin system VapC family toxin [Planctomycetota bacterium]
MYLLDTDTLIFYLRGHAHVVGCFRLHETSPKALSVVTYGELLYGAYKSAQPVENAARVRRLGELLPVVEISSAVIESFAHIKAELEGRGTRLDDFDLLIASTAMHLNYTLVTNNTAHFRNVPGLVLENWSRAP